jgi:hypothetical protein
MSALAWGISQGERTPLPFEATPTGASPAIDARPRRHSTRASNPQEKRPLCPCAALTGCLHPETAPLLASHQPHWGFPIPLFRRRERKERRRREKKGGGGEEGGRAATTPRRENRRPSAIRSWSRQDRSCRAKGESRPCSRSQSRGSAAAVNIYLADVNLYTEPATTTPPTQRERHRGRPFLSSPLFSFL